MSDRPLRPDQAEMIDRIRESLRSGKRKPLIQFPTGGGKTRIMTGISQMAKEKGNKSILFAPRRELIKQGAADLAKEGMSPSIIMAGYTQTNRCDSYVASFDTVNSRAIRQDILDMPKVGLGHVDEAHLSITKTRIKIMDMLGCPVLGWTATPARADGTGMGSYYDDLIIGPSPGKLMEMGVLVPPKYFGCPADIDWSSLDYNKKKGDYTDASLATLEDKATLIGDVVTNWERLAKDRHTVVFATNIKHSLNLCREFQRKGYKAASIDYTTPEPERASILERVASRDIQILCNVFIASYGLDIPSLDCAVIARPTKNISLYLQTVGRVLRRDWTRPDKVDAFVIDHVNAIQENGFVEDEQPWSLDGESNVKEAKKQKQKEKKEPKDITCEACSFVFRSSRQCPACGHQMIKPDEQIPAFDFTLEEIRKQNTGHGTPADLNKNTPRDQKEWFIRQLNFISRERGYNKGWVSHKYREKFGVWPNAINREGYSVPEDDTYKFLQKMSNKYRYQKRKEQLSKDRLTETQSLI